MLLVRHYHRVCVGKSVCEVAMTRTELGEPTFEVTKAARIAAAARAQLGASYSLSSSVVSALLVGWYKVEHDMNTLDVRFFN